MLCFGKLQQTCGRRYHERYWTEREQNGNREGVERRVGAERELSWEQRGEQHNT